MLYIKRKMRFFVGFIAPRVAFRLSWTFSIETYRQTAFFAKFDRKIYFWSQNGRFHTKIWAKSVKHPIDHFEWMREYLSIVPGQWADGTQNKQRQKIKQYSSYCSTVEWFIKQITQKMACFHTEISKRRQCFRNLASVELFSVLNFQSEWGSMSLTSKAHQKYEKYNVFVDRTGYKMFKKGLFATSSLKSDEQNMP